MGALMTSEVPDGPKEQGFSDIYISDRYGSEDPDDVGWRQLHDAIINNDVDECRSILRTHVDGRDPLVVDMWINTPRRGGRLVRTSPPLHLACMHRRPAIVKLLLENGSNPYSMDNFGRSALALLLEYWPRISFDWEGKTESRDQKEFKTRLLEQHQRASGCLSHLLETGIDANAVVDTRFKQTALHLCGRYNITEPIRPLLERGANIEKIDFEMKTPLLYAASVAHGRTYQELLRNGADVHVTDYAHRLTLHYLCDSTNIDHKLVEETLKLNVDVNARDFTGDTPLHRAAKRGTPEQIRTLLNAGAEPDVFNNRNRSPLFNILHRSERLIVAGFLPLLMMSYSVHLYDNNGELPSLLRRRGFNDFSQGVFRIGKKLPSLQRCCLVRLRRLMGIDRCTIDVVKSLPLPKVLQDGVLGSEELLVLATCIHPIFILESGADHWRENVQHITGS